VTHPTKDQEENNSEATSQARKKAISYTERKKERPRLNPRKRRGQKTFCKSKKKRGEK